MDKVQCCFASIHGPCRPQNPTHLCSLRYIPCHVPSANRPLATGTVRLGPMRELWRVRRSKGNESESPGSWMRLVMSAREG